MTDDVSLPREDLKILRDLAAWQATEAASPRNREKIDAWYAHDAGDPGRRPMLLVEVGYGRPHWPVGDEDLQCTDPWARGIEAGFRMKKYLADELQDDHVVPPFIAYHPAVSRTDFGVGSSVKHKAGADGLAFHYQAVLTTLDDEELARLKPRKTTFDRAATDAAREKLQSVFADILPVEMHDAPWQLGTPLTSTALNLVGLEGFMILMYDNPSGLHKLMAFLRDDQLAFLDALEAQDAYPLNNSADYVGSGSMGYTRDLPAPDFSGTVRCRDRWGLAESQESVSIGPEQYGEFVFAYLKPLMARFGKVYYGCCEPVHAIWHHLETVPNLSRVSVSPWADEAFVGKACRDSNVAYSRKPSPNFLSGETFDEAALADHFAETVSAARGCRLEIIQRDVYVTHAQPQRLLRWVALARNACERWHA